MKRINAPAAIVRAFAALLSFVTFADQDAAAQQPLFISKQLTPRMEYTEGIEGPAVDASGNLYAVNLKVKGDIGRLRPGAARSEQFARLPRGSVGNGIRFDREGRMYVADYKAHKIFVFGPGRTEPETFFQSRNFAQPNDLAVGADGAIYASDPDFKSGGGKVWRIERGPEGKAAGAPMISVRKMAIPNGIDLSVDGNILYVSESSRREIWAYRIDGRKLIDPKLIIRFDAGELDGLRTDIEGRIYVARLGVGKIAVVSPGGALLREIALLGKNPTNLTFGGTDGRTVYVTQKDGRFIESFSVDVAGREACLLALSGSPCASAPN